MITVWVLHAAAVGAGVVLMVLFQPELRHALSMLEVALKRSDRRSALSQALEVVSAAAFSLAGAGRGALLVLTRHDSVNELLQGGVPLGGHVSPEILEAVSAKSRRFTMVPRLSKEIGSRGRSTAPAVPEREAAEEMGHASPGRDGARRSALMRWSWWPQRNEAM